MPGSRGEGSAGKAFARALTLGDRGHRRGQCRFRALPRCGSAAGAPGDPQPRRSSRGPAELLGAVSVHFREALDVPRQRDMQMADACSRHVADVIEARRTEEAREAQRARLQGDRRVARLRRLERRSRGRLYLRASCIDSCKLVGRGVSRNAWEIPLEKDLLHPEDREPVFASWQAWRRGRPQVGFANSGSAGLRPGAHHSILSRAAPVRDARGVIVSWAGINLDIDRLKRVETELRETDQRKNEFLATLAHELRNPLAPLRNGLEVLKLAGANTAASDRAREMMERQMGQLVRLVDDLLDVSRVSRGKVDLRCASLASSFAAVLAQRDRDAASRCSPNANTSSWRAFPERKVDRRCRHEPPAVAGVLEPPQQRGEVHAQGRTHRARRERRRRVGSHPACATTASASHPRCRRSASSTSSRQVDRDRWRSRRAGWASGFDSIAQAPGGDARGGTIEVASAGSGEGSEFTVRLPAVTGAPPK